MKLAITGKGGGGKTTLCNLIPRFYDVTAGQVLVDGVDVRDYPLAELRNRIGMVLQTNVLFSGTVKENLLWGRADATDEEARARQMPDITWEALLEGAVHRVKVVGTLRATLTA